MAKSSKSDNTLLWILMIIIIFGFLGIAIGGGLTAISKSRYKQIDKKEKYCSKC
jgi:hypothetical protein